MASTREREGRFTGLYRDRYGKQRSAGTFSTKAKALKAARASEALESQGRDAQNALRSPENAYPVSRRGFITVAGYGPQWLSGHRLEATSRECYAAMFKHIERGLGTVTLRDLTPADVRAFFRKLESGGMTGGTEGHVLTVLREMCKTAVNDGLMEKDPTFGVKIQSRRTREMIILQPEEYGRLLMSVPSQHRLTVRALIETGLRWGELMGLRAEDIKDGKLTVRRVIIEVNGRTQVRDYGKTSRAMRTISIDPDLERDLTAREGFVIRAEKGGPLTRSNFRRIWKRALKDAGIDPSLRVHDLRHTHASWLLANGADLVSVRDRLGHSDISVTSRYLHTLDRDTDPCLSALSVALRAVQSHLSEAA